MPHVRPLRPGDPERIGGYRLAGVLGSGGQGVVYQGVGDTGREVAVKLLHSHLSHDDDVTKGFLREVEAARRVAAFCTAAVLDVGMHDERPYIVSEYVPGETLQALVRSSGPRTGGALDRLAISTLTALAAIHQAGIVHRDFKPGNVLIGPEGPIVIDFGIAKALDATTRGASGPIGTPTYMSPEQFGGERIGPASDLFSWAGTMMFAATGRPAFAGETVPAILHQILSGSPDLVGVPPHLLEPIRACLAKDPAARPTTADLLQRLIRHPGPTAHPHPVPAPAPASTAEAETAPSRPRRVSRRVLITGGVAATAAVAVSAFAVFRPEGPEGEVVRPGGDALRPNGDVPQPDGGTRTVGGSPTPTAEPFGTPIEEPVPLPEAGGDPTTLAATAATVVCGTAKGAVLAWDMGTAAATRLGDGGGSVTAVATGDLGGTRVVASGHADGRMRLWSLAGESLATHRAGDPVIAVTVAAGRAVAVTEKYDGTTDLHSVVRLWDISTGKRIGATITDHFQGVEALAFGRLGEQDVLVTGDGGERIRVRRLSTGKLTHSFHTGEIGGIEQLACGRIKGRPVLVSTHLDATLRVYDLATGKRRKRWTFSDQSPDDRGAGALAVGMLGDLPIAAVSHTPAGGDAIVRVRNLDDGEIIGILGPGDGGEIRTLALGELDGRTVIVGADEQRALRVWSLGPA
ncbi:WD40 repeat domain-containing serine/threonine protein kinase [Nonomuraea sp. LPB2021202275-12-8]|uniref:WD40 repeat domain-containing serine/threonine protein kinase n=1 Tax=Nonomuraea sp. LPB2021202275-12-8 TaxID=3120159 RepID=UPI00300D7048